MDSFAPHGFTTFLQETWEVRGRAKEYGYFLSVVLFFGNRRHSLNQEAVGPSVNRDHNIWTTQKRKMCCAVVVKLCIISTSIAISILTTRCYTISYSGPLIVSICQDVSGIQHEDAWFLLRTRWDTMDTGRCPQLTIVLFFLSACWHIVHLKAVIVVVSVPPVGLTCSQLDGPDGLSQEAELRSVQV